jgi:anti-sigma factor RsiW
MSASPQSTEDPVLLLHAYVDGELDPVNALAVERHIASDPGYAAQRDRIVALRQALAEKYPREMPSPALLGRIAETTGLRRTAARPAWLALAASLLLGAVLGGGATFLLNSATHIWPRAAATQTADLVLAAHLRGLISSPTDVTSSEGHTVKPWYNGRIPRAPRVIDLSQAGFPLVGGRIDVIGREPVPTIVYRRRQHIISLTQLPGGNETPSDPTRDDVNGFNRIGWTDRAVSYWAVSDLNSSELGEFVRLFRAQP